MTKVQIDFLNFIMKEDKDIKILFLINKSLLPKYNKNWDIIESNEKRIFKKTIKTNFKDNLSLKRLIEEDNIIELNLKYNERTQTKAFGIKNSIKKLYSLFENYYINIENQSKINQTDLYNCFFLKDIKTSNDLFIKIKGKIGYLLNSFLIIACLISYSPIPFIDNAVVLSLDISLVIQISKLFGISLTKSRAKEILEFILFGKNSGFNIMRLLGFSIRIIDLIGDGAKFIPIIGTVTGGVISNAANVGEIYFIYKQIINYYIEKFKEQ